ncbi:MAG TPA: 4-hydroxy-2-oxoheptanedioate aldolase [Rhizobium sp.]|nr:4-hydroxy-2-oxoheptanedioate aldolase [Rhizobium sp.]
MPAPVNAFKEALLDGETLFGLWVALGSPFSAELCAGAGYDWILIDGEHGPNDIPGIAAQLQAAAQKPAHPVVRIPIGETWIVKQALDIGAQTLLIPMIETADQAEKMVKACRYPPHGVRGVGAALARASDFGRITDYLHTANREICVLLQIESRAGLANLEAIANTEGVDGVFIGPADLAADMGYLGNPGAPEVVAAVEDAIKRIKALGKPAGIMSSDPAMIDRALSLGAGFVAVGSDVGLLSKAASRLLAELKG